MELKYFPDTDTLLINFTHKDIVETRDINENILVELDEQSALRADFSIRGRPVARLKRMCPA